MRDLALNFPKFEKNGKNSCLSNLKLLRKWEMHFIV
jgi:hypothetical protein